MFPFLGKKPNPFFPTTQPSKTLILFFKIVFLIIVFEPIEQLSPMITFFSIIEYGPILTLLPMDAVL